MMEKKTIMIKFLFFFFGHRGCTYEGRGSIQQVLGLGKRLNVLLLWTRYCESSAKRPLTDTSTPEPRASSHAPQHAPAANAKDEPFEK